MGRVKPNALTTIRQRALVPCRMLSVACMLRLFVPARVGEWTPECTNSNSGVCKESGRVDPSALTTISTGSASVSSSEYGREECTDNKNSTVTVAESAVRARSAPAVSRKRSLTLACSGCCPVKLCCCYCWCCDAVVVQRTLR